MSISFLKYIIYTPLNGIRNKKAPDLRMLFQNNSTDIAVTIPYQFLRHPVKVKQCGFALIEYPHFVQAG